MNAERTTRSLLALNVASATSEAASHAARRGSARPGHFVAVALLLAGGWAQADAAPAAPRPDIERPAEAFTWTPQIAPDGPMLIVVSLLEQQAYVYRNGIRIGMSSVSTGKPGHETPTGVFTILQKRREHYSNLYDNAPMPYMQRLTWDGIALHAGKLPGYPASHGCVRLPYAFSEKLFGITSTGMTVVVTASIPGKPVATSPGLFATPERPQDAGVADRPTSASDALWSWHPERSPHGPMNLLLSTQDKQIVVLRGGVEVGWARVELQDSFLRGTSVYTLLEGRQSGPSPVVAERPALRWLAVPMADETVPTTDPVRAAIAAGRLVVPQAFARQIYDALTPGATLVVTGESIHGRSLLVPGTLFEAHEPAQASPSQLRR